MGSPWTSLGPPLVAIYVMADVGSIAGGWLPAVFLRRGWSLNRSRKSAMLLCAVTVAPIVFAAKVQNLCWVAVGLIGLAAASHQGWSANVYTLASDMFPRRAVASVVGISGFGGAVGGMLVSTFTGIVLQFTGSYVPLFVMAGSAYLPGAAGGPTASARIEARRQSTKFRSHRRASRYAVGGIMSMTMKLTAVFSMKVPGGLRGVY